jgi:MFS family permease
MNKYLKILLAGSYTWYFGAGLLGPLYAVFAEKIGGDILDLAGAYALFLIIMGTLSIFVGKISDHHSKKNLMMVGYVLNAATTFGYLLVDSPAKLFAVQALFGIAVALATPTWDSLFSIHLEKKHVGWEWGLSDGGPNIIMGIALIAGGLIVTYFSFSTLFIAMGIIQVIAVVIQSYIYKIDEKNL